MTEGTPSPVVIATIKSCEQYRFRVELPRVLDRKIRADLRYRALLDTNQRFLECTRNYQSIAWVGPANLAFTDASAVPTDSKSEFLHLLVCLRTIELSHLHHRGTPVDETAFRFVVEVKIPLRWSVRNGLQKLCESLGIGLQIDVSAEGGNSFKSRIGGAFRSVRHPEKPFTHEPIKRIADLRAALGRRMTKVPPLKHLVMLLLTAATWVFWPFSIVTRVVFSMGYRLAAVRVLKKLEGGRNVFCYFDLRLGRNRDVGAYLRWKYGNAFADARAAGASVITFSHLARSHGTYSVPAMWWACQSLKRMRTNPLEGCVVVNYLIPPTSLLQLKLRRKRQSHDVRRCIGNFRKETTDFISSLIYAEFMSNLARTGGFAIEISKAYENFFGLLAPGVVVQADAVAKTARNFTAAARCSGSRVIYVADRICTRLRTSNQLIADGGGNPHFPNAFVVFDEVTKGEFIRQGTSRERIYPYHRNFSAEHGETTDRRGGEVRQVVILLQAYEDNIGRMVRLGAEIASSIPTLTILYQEHPNFPVGATAKSKLLAENPGRLRFLEPREPVNHGQTLALITGYSTAVVPGIMQGVPLIWLRREIDNSIFCAEFLARIGFAADKSGEVVSLLKRLMRRDPAALAACVAATAEAKAIFEPGADYAGRSLSEALGHAMEDLFEEITSTRRVASPAANDGSVLVGN